jgi:hypothetical protein
MYFLTLESKLLLDLQFVKDAIPAKCNKMRYACIWTVYIITKKEKENNAVTLL